MISGVSGQVPRAARGAAVTDVAGMLGAVNPEGRAGLLPPDRVVSAPVLSKLRLTPEAARCIAASLDGPASVSVSLAANEAIAQRVLEDTAPGRGAPAEAGAVEEDAMLCGHRFGQLALGPLVRRRPISPWEIRLRTDSMYLYALFVWDTSTPAGRVPAGAILSRHAAGHI